MPRTHHRRPILALTLGMLAAAPPIHAQDPDSTYASRRIARLVSRLRADPTLPDSLRQLSTRDLVDPTNTSYFRLLDDSTSSVFVRLAAATLHQVPDSACGRLLGPETGPTVAFADLLPFLDSSTVDSWAVLLDRVVRLRAAGGPGMPLASPTRVEAVTLAILEALGPADRKRLVFLSQHPPPSRADACWSAQLLMDGLAAMPPTALGPVARAMFGPSTQAAPESP
jgi:hypothetical protein